MLNLKLRIFLQPASEHALPASVHRLHQYAASCEARKTHKQDLNNNLPTAAHLSPSTRSTSSTSTCVARQDHQYLITSSFQSSELFHCILQLVSQSIIST